jgi:hypothetical protein
MTDEEKKVALAHLKDAVNPIKSNLLQIARRLDLVSVRKAESLRTIIGRLEDWQHK